jgi:hypothetical protein
MTAERCLDLACGDNRSMPKNRVKLFMAETTN